MRLRRLGVEVEHPQLELGRLARHHPAEAPQRGTGQLPGALAFQHLRTPGDEPQALLGRRVRVRNALHQGERGSGRVLRVRRHLFGRRVRSVAVERREMDDAGERRVPGQVLEQRPPRLAALHVDVCARDRGLALVRTRRGTVVLAVEPRFPRGVPGSAGIHPAAAFMTRRFVVGPRQLSVRLGLPARQHHGLVPRRELRCQRLRHAAPVRGQDPDSRRLLHLRRTLRHDHAPIRQAGRCRPIHAENLGLRKARIGECPTPHVGPCERMVRAVAIGITPPSVQLTEYQVHPAPAALVLQRHQ